MSPSYTHKILCHYSDHGLNQKGYNNSLQKQDNTHMPDSGLHSYNSTKSDKGSISSVKIKGRLSIGGIWKTEHNYNRSTHLFLYVISRRHFNGVKEKK